MADLYLAKQMHSLFLGMESAHGQFIPGEYDGKKLKGTAQTVREVVTDEKWLDHLDGKPPSLGIVPINEESECYWGVIDVDNYDLDYEAILNQVEGTPLVCCKSKSGGVWLFIFTKQAVPAKLIRSYLLTMTSSLGLGNSEIFPKQEKIYADRGDVGNWLNMPYYGLTRLCIRLDYTRNGAGPLHELTLSDFIEYVQYKRVTGEFFTNINSFNYEESPIEHGPPCLQVLSLKGFPNHTRNVSLLNVGIYYKKAQPEQWQSKLRLFNTERLSQPLSLKEVETIIKSLQKKEYFYQCSIEPLCSFCNPQLCRTRKYGISSGNSLPIINSITKISGDEAMWFIDVEGGKLQLTTNEFYDFRQFSLKCMNDLGIIPAPMKKETWTGWIQAQMDKVIEIKVETMYAYSELNTNLTSFITNRLSNDMHDVSNGRVWYDTLSHEVRFRVDSFIAYLKYRRVITHKGTIIMFLKDKGGEHGVGKTNDRKSYKYIRIPVTLEQQQIIESKNEKGEIL